MRKKLKATIPSNDVNLFLMCLFGIILISISLQTVMADTVAFTQTTQSTLNSYTKGHLLVILEPQDDVLYNGSFTYTSSNPVQIFVLHDVSSDRKGQPIFTLNDKIFAVSILDGINSSGSAQFTGSGLALHSSKQFTSTSSVVYTSLKPTLNLQSLKIAHSHVPITIPMHMGIHNNESIYYIVTDSSSLQYSTQITKKQDWPVQTSTILNETPKSALEEIYVFTNGPRGTGLNGYQVDVFSTTPHDTEYSPLCNVMHVTWSATSKRIVLNSTVDILEAKLQGKVRVEPTSIILNTPQIAWSNSSMKINKNSEPSYVGGQVLSIDKINMTVEFVAHRARGPDGNSIFFIITDSTPDGPSKLFGIPHSTTADMVISSAAADLYQFKNGIHSSGPLGFQPSIATTDTTDKGYSPIRRIYTVGWAESAIPVLLETHNDINIFHSNQEIIIQLAKPLGKYHVINAPIVDPFLD